MAPEQFINARQADPRFDVYSLGATLYMAVTGQIPFRASSPFNVLKKKQQGELTPVRALVPGLSERIEQTISRAVSADPGRRHASCQEFIAELTGKPSGRGRSRRSSGAVRVPSAVSTVYSGKEKRAHIRYASTQEGRCLALASHPEDEWPARVCDVSQTGISLVVKRRFEAGTVLCIRLQRPKESPRYLLVRVVRQQAQSSRRWLLGCAFAASLTEEEVQALV
jgi:serine/threonine protein kinase